MNSYRFQILKDWLRQGRAAVASIGNQGEDIRRLLTAHRACALVQREQATAQKREKLRWGMLGTGAIAKKFAGGISESLTGRLVAVASRRREAAEQFTVTHPAKAYGGYEALLADPEVDVVYIATPHPFHAEWAIKTAEAGKHILCEKPLTMNHAEAVKVVDAARSNGVFLMEAFMYRCHPQTEIIRELIRKKIIGDVQFIEASFSFRAPSDPNGRLLSRALGGGGILDVGCYCASMARMVAGVVDGVAFADPIKVSGSGMIGKQSGVDEYAIASLEFENGVLAQLASGVRLALENRVRIWGTEGHIHIPSPWSVRLDSGVSNIYVQRNAKGHREKIAIYSDRGVYALEADHVAEYLAAGQSPSMSCEDSLGNMRTLDRWREAIGLS